jgi:hypothetical protein
MGRVLHEARCSSTSCWSGTCSCTRGTLGRTSVTSSSPSSSRTSRAPAGRASPLLNLARNRGTAWRRGEVSRAFVPLSQRAAWVRGGDHGGGGHRQGAHPGGHRLRHLPREVPVRRLPPIQGRDPRGRRHHGQ